MCAKGVLGMGIISDNIWTGYIRIYTWSLALLYVITKYKKCLSEYGPWLFERLVSVFVCERGSCSGAVVYQMRLVEVPLCQ